MTKVRPPTANTCRPRVALAIVVLATATQAAAVDDCEPCGYPPAIALDAVYTADAWRNTSGGIATGTRYLDNLDLTLTVDGAAFGLDNLQLFAYGLYDNGHVLSDELVGAAQGVSNIETSRGVRLYELWLDWQFAQAQPGHSSSLRFGLYDLNSEFDAIETAGLFINPSHGIGVDFAQSGQNGPSIFPATSLAVRSDATRGPWTVRAAVLDGVPGDPNDSNRSTVRFNEGDGLLLVGEVNYSGSAGLRLGSGYWRYTSDFDDLLAVDVDGNPAQRDDNAGFYVFAESPSLFAGDDDDSGLRFFVRAGGAADRINPVGRYTGGGAVYSGLFAPGDQLGIAVAVATLGDPYRSAQGMAGIATLRRESNVELTYRREVTDWLTLQPDVQYVRNPGMTPGIDAAWVVGLRFEASWSWAR